MGDLVNFVSELLDKKQMSKPDFVLAMLNQGISQDTSYRLIRGETNFTTETLRTAAKVLGVESINEVIDISGNGQH